MISRLLLNLLMVSAAASVAVVIVGLLRAPLRRAVGARSAYWLWLLVPAGALAVLPPAPSKPAGLVLSGAPAAVKHAVVSAVSVLPATASSGYAVTELLVWLAGTAAMLGILVHRHRSFIRSLGALSARPDGTWRSQSVAGPMLVGAWRARIVLPADLETRYTRAEAALIVAHERAHLRRGDALVNAIAAGWLCVSWFNPLMYWAVGWLRFDQELASDALALAATHSSRRQYANALLKAQLASDSGRGLPLGCRWQSSHPLSKRVAMLHHPLPGFSRRAFGVAVALTIIAASSYTAWAIQPEVHLQGSGTPIAINMRWLINRVELPSVAAQARTRDFLVTDGSDFVRSYPFAPGDAEQIRCVASLPDGRQTAPGWHVSRAWKKFTSATGRSTAKLILLECIWRRNGKILFTPSLIVKDGAPSAVEVSGPDGLRRRVEFNASTSRARIAAAQH